MRSSTVLEFVGFGFLLYADTFGDTHGPAIQLAAIPLLVHMLDHARSRARRASLLVVLAVCGTWGFLEVVGARILTPGGAVATMGVSLLTIGALAKVRADLEPEREPVPAQESEHSV